MTRMTVALIGAILFTGSALARDPSPAGAEVYIVAPKDGARVKGPVTVVFGLKGMGIAPAGISQPAAATIPVRFSPGGTNTLVQIQGEKGDWISETWPYGDLPAPTIDGSEPKRSRQSA